MRNRRRCKRKRGNGYRGLAGRAEGFIFISESKTASPAGTSLGVPRYFKDKDRLSLRGRCRDHCSGCLRSPTPYRCKCPRLSHALARRDCPWLWRLRAETTANGRCAVCSPAVTRRLPGCDEVGGSLPTMASNPSNSEPQWLAVGGTGGAPLHIFGTQSVCRPDLWMASPSFISSSNRVNANHLSLGPWISRCGIFENCTCSDA